MSRLATAFLTAVLLAASSPAEAQQGPVLRADHLVHFGASALVASSGYGVAASLWEGPLPRLGLGLGAAIAAGGAKELADLAGLGVADWRDLVADLLGAVAGAFLAWAIDEALHRRRGGRRAAFARAAPF